MESFVKIIGTQLDEDHIPELMKEYDCNDYRIILPDSFYTEDFNAHRLSICINFQKKILDIKKG